MKYILPVLSFLKEVGAILTFKECARRTDKAYSYDHAVRWGLLEV